MGLHLHPWRTRLTVPMLKLTQIPAVRIGHRHSKIIAGHCLTIVACKVQIHSFAKAIDSQKRLIHAYHLSAFFIDGDGIKIINLLIGIGANRVGHRARIFRKLQLAQ